jgi:hypothetical protein
VEDIIFYDEAEIHIPNFTDVIKPDFINFIDEPIDFLLSTYGMTVDGLTMELKSWAVGHEDDTILRNLHHKLTNFIDEPIDFLLSTYGMTVDGLTMELKSWAVGHEDDTTIRRLALRLDSFIDNNLIIQFASWLADDLDNSMDIILELIDFKLRSVELYIKDHYPPIFTNRDYFDHLTPVEQENHLKQVEYFILLTFLCSFTYIIAIMPDVYNYFEDWYEESLGFGQDPENWRPYPHGFDYRSGVWEHNFLKRNNLKEDPLYLERCLKLYKKADYTRDADPLMNTRLFRLTAMSDRLDPELLHLPEEQLFNVALLVAFFNEFSDYSFTQIFDQWYRDIKNIHKHADIKTWQSPAFPACSAFDHEGLPTRPSTTYHVLDTDEPSMIPDIFIGPNMLFPEKNKQYILKEDSPLCNAIEHLHTFYVNYQMIQNRPVYVDSFKKEIWDNMENFGFSAQLKDKPYCTVRDSDFTNTYILNTIIEAVIASGGILNNVYTRLCYTWPYFSFFFADIEKAHEEFFVGLLNLFYDTYITKDGHIFPVLKSQQDIMRLRALFTMQSIFSGHPFFLDYDSRDLFQLLMDKPEEVLIIAHHMERRTNRWKGDQPVYTRKKMFYNHSLSSNNLYPMSMKSIFRLGIKIDKPLSSGPFYGFWPHKSESTHKYPAKVTVDNEILIEAATAWPPAVKYWNLPRLPDDQSTKPALPLLLLWESKVPINRDLLTWFFGAAFNLWQPLSNFDANVRSPNKRIRLWGIRSGPILYQKKFNSFFIS